MIHLIVPNVEKINNELARLHISEVFVLSFLISILWILWDCLSYAFGFLSLMSSVTKYHFGSFSW